MKKLGFFFEINTIDQNFRKFNLLDNKKINLINVEYNLKNALKKFQVNQMIIKTCFSVALKILNKINYLNLLMVQFQKNLF